MFFSKMQAIEDVALIKDLQGKEQVCCGKFNK